MLLDKEVEVRLNSRNITRLRSLGYVGEVRDLVKVKVEDMSVGSSVEVNVLCDYCKEKVIRMSIGRYNKQMNETGDCCCTSCVHKKIKKTLNKLYGEGINNTFQLEQTKQKIRETCLEKYGVENYASSSECREKMKKTSLERYGTEHPGQSDIVKQKTIKTNMEKYGIPYTIGTDEVRDKIKKSVNKKYGVDNVFSLPETQIKIAKTKYDNNLINTSYQQKYLHNLYGGKLNYPIDMYYADIFLENDNIICEYDGSGHNLHVKFGEITEEEFNQKMLIRSNIIRRKGYKIITIISNKDKLPSDEILLQMLEQAKEYFNTTNHTWVEYNIDTSLMRNAEHKDGVFFDYGKLKTIKNKGGKLNGK